MKTDILLQNLKELLNPRFKEELRKVIEDRQKLEDEKKNIDVRLLVDISYYSVFKNVDDQIKALDSNYYIKKRNDIFEKFFNYIFEACSVTKIDLYKIGGHFLKDNQNRKGFTIYIEREYNKGESPLEMRHTIEKDGQNYFIRVSIADIGNTVYAW